MKVLVLGCGPAGLMAAQGATDAMMRFDEQILLSIISRKVKSKLYGAQYLHAPIPRATPVDPIRVRYRLQGTADEYRRKVYGQLWDGTVSPEDLEEDHYAYDIRRTYDALWDRWAYAVSDAEVDPVGLMNIFSDEVDLVISSIPRQNLCHMGHAFGSTRIIAAGDAPELGIRVPYKCAPSTIVCNGEDNPAWYRMSNVFGHTTVEWPGSIEYVPIQTAAVTSKPTKTDCNCFPDVFRVGRYGRWEKGVLSHTAYFSTYRKVNSIMEARRAATEV